MVEVNVLSIEYIKFAVYAKEAGVVVNPTADTVSVAVKPTGTAPSSGDFHTASWEVDSGTYYARFLFGGTGYTGLAAGIYDVYVKIVDSLETPVHEIGSLRVVT